jgi:hypothetical protein
VPVRDMTTARYVTSALESVLSDYHEPLPQELVTLASNYNSQAQRKITGLKPDEEAARYMVCAHLAVEKLMSTLQLPHPNGTRAPVPPKVYNNLVSMFRNVLIKGGDQSSPSKATPTSFDAPLTPSKRSRRAQPPDQFLAASGGKSRTPSKTPKRYAVPFVNSATIGD